MHIHILGICGTFMGGIAMVARQAGHKVTGSDRNVYPPMSDELKAAGIEIVEGYDAAQLDLNPDLIVVGNVMKRGMTVIERMLNEKWPYVSGPQWLYEHYLQHKKVLCVAGTHGKTTTTSMLCHILNEAGLNPGFLVGGIPENFGISARSTDSPYFVIEGDEYDCAFFDKRAKFVHYHPDVVILNNLEYDHADIYENLAAIQKQFHHLVRTVPSAGTVVVPSDCKALDEVLHMGLWSHEVRVGGEDLTYELLSRDGSAFKVMENGKAVTEVHGPFTGLYSVHNALMALAAARAVGVSLETGAQALASFKMPKRRMELKGTVGEVSVYDDFAHHPTAVRVTLEGLRAHLDPDTRLIAVFEPRSNSMKAGVNGALLPHAFDSADEVYVYASPEVRFNVADALKGCPVPCEVDHDFEHLVATLVHKAHGKCAILCMSNGSFNGIHGKILYGLRHKAV